MFPIRDHNPSGRVPFVTFALIAVNVVTFLAYYPAASELWLARFYYTWGVIPADMWAFDSAATWISHMFIHAGWMHLAGNMLFLWIFGDNLESEMGHAGFLLFYLLAGAAAAIGQALPDPGSAVPMVGASGAIAGVMGGYLLLYPRAQVDVLLIVVIFFRVFTLPAWLVLGLWFAIQIFSGVAVPGDGVAYLAHAGGFVAGLILTLPLWLRRGGRRFWQENAGHPPHPGAEYSLSQSRIPRVGRR
ncbi:rhomboid family intramembrane serine protease [Xinfangfangia sp. D13-10-4-6]|uniref:rhomboid family intramembrane serine protease n=1 Tax=Pseudogemmobacter hezensis TaxID=2737662 RepID=UPI00155400EA|nr:rhomboid family intramembrane serine protease [Pseudogemmobacter hezensis]NPD15300.1 rhomboid family intramembrane serine protease [Pseudogemmobacter hezensis]